MSHRPTWLRLLAGLGAFVVALFVFVILTISVQGSPAIMSGMRVGLTLVAVAIGVVVYRRL